MAWRWEDPTKAFMQNRARDERFDTAQRGVDDFARLKSQTNWHIRLEDKDETAADRAETAAAAKVRADTLEARRGTLRSMRDQERRRWHGELAERRGALDGGGGLDAKMEDYRDKCLQLKDRRSAERTKLADVKYEQRFRSMCDELRGASRGDQSAKMLELRAEDARAREAIRTADDATLRSFHTAWTDSTNASLPGAPSDKACLAEATVTLELDFAQVCSSIAKRRGFETRFRKDLGNVLGVAWQRVQVVSCAAGSVVVRFRVMRDPDDAASRRPAASAPAAPFALHDPAPRVPRAAAASADGPLSAAAAAVAPAGDVLGALKEALRSARPPLLAGAVVARLEEGPAAAGGPPPRATASEWASRLDADVAAKRTKALAEAAGERDFATVSKQAWVAEGDALAAKADVARRAEFERVQELKRLNEAAKGRHAEKAQEAAAQDRMLLAYQLALGQEAAAEDKAKRAKDLAAVQEHHKLLVSQRAEERAAEAAAAKDPAFLAAEAEYYRKREEAMRRDASAREELQREVHGDWADARTGAAATADARARQAADADEAERRRLAAERAAGDAAEHDSAAAKQRAAAAALETGLRERQAADAEMEAARVAEWRAVQAEAEAYDSMVDRLAPASWKEKRRLAAEKHHREMEARLAATRSSLGYGSLLPAERNTRAESTRSHGPDSHDSQDHGDIIAWS